MISEALWQSYRQTTYRVFADEETIDIRIGEHQGRLDALLQRYQATEWAFVTAWNPFSTMLPESENEQRQRRLLGRLQDKGLPWLQGSGIGLTGWSEASLFVPGLDEGRAVALGRDFEQNAVVVGTLGTPARLVMCFPERD